MNKFTRFRLGDHQPPPTTDSRPAIVPCSGGGTRTTLPLVEENHHQSVGDDDVGQKLGLWTAVSRKSPTALHHDLQTSTSHLGRASNPTALDDHGDDAVDATVSRNGHIHPPPANSPTPLR